MRIYIAGKYSHNTAEERQQNVQLAREALTGLMLKGHHPLCPHTMTEGLEHIEGLSYSDFMDLYIDWLQQAEAVLMLPNWRDSPGAWVEYREARRLGLQVYYSLDDVPNAKVAI